MEDLLESGPANAAPGRAEDRPLDAPTVAAALPDGL
jgi:hypothetical protein